jgi:hypothetical protein
MKAVGRYDTSLQMFVEEPRDPDLRQLNFLRWLIENDRMEHPAVGPAAGDLALLIAEDIQAELPLAS